MKIIGLEWNSSTYGILFSTERHLLNTLETSAGLSHPKGGPGGGGQETVAERRN